MVTKGYWKKYYRKNREKLRAYHREYCRTHPEKIKAKYSKRNKVTDRKKSHRYYHSNLETVSQYHRRRYLENKERLIEATKMYRKTPGGILTTRRHSLNRMSLKKGAKYLLTKDKIQRIMEKANGKCTYCFVPISVLTFSIDHVKPLSKGGTNHGNNLVACCRTCNARKNAKSLKRFLKELKNHA